jgi:hypothetical protein
MRRLYTLALFAVGVVGGAAPAQTPIQFGSGSVSITGGGAASFENFDSLATNNSGSNNTLPLGWYASEAGAATTVNGQYTASEGSVSGGDTYSFGGARQTDRALGTVSSASFTPIIGVRLTNNTGAQLAGGNISYYGELWRRGASGRSDGLNFQYSTNATTLNTGTWLDASTLSYTSPAGSGSGLSLDGNANRTQISGTLSGLSVADGGDVWFRWVDVPLSGSNDGMGIDDFSFTPADNPVPEPASVGLVAAVGLGAAALMRRRRRAKG